MMVAEPMAVLALAGSPSELPLNPAVRRRVRRVEIRLDLVDDPTRWTSRLREAERAFPSARMLATLRLDSDGGSWPAGADRVRALEPVIGDRGWDCVDLEADAPDLADLVALLERKAPDLRRVVSRHSFRAVSTEEALEQIEGVRARARELRGAVAKWAGSFLDTDESCPELARLLALWDGPGVPAVFPMGTGAEPWRVACAVVGGGWAYGHDGTGAVAPGQLAWRVLDALVGAVPRTDRWDPEWFEGVRRATALALREEAAQ
jgi:3-dehydroquinate dehydratase type I